MNSEQTVFERIWENHDPNILLRYQLGASNLGVMAVADIFPAEGTDHMIVIAPSIGGHGGERSIAQYPDEICLAFDTLANFMDLQMQPFATDDRVVKRMVSNNKIKNHPHQVLYIAERGTTLSETTQRLRGDLATTSVEQTVADLKQTDESAFSAYLMRRFGLFKLPS